MRERRSTASRQRGAALLLAMVILTLVTSSNEARGWYRPIITALEMKELTGSINTFC